MRLGCGGGCSNKRTTMALTLMETYEYTMRLGCGGGRNLKKTALAASLQTYHVRILGKNHGNKQIIH
jgi:hypothetical protein